MPAREADFTADTPSPLTAARLLRCEHHRAFPCGRRRARAIESAARAEVRVERGRRMRRGKLGKPRFRNFEITLAIAREGASVRRQLGSDLGACRRTHRLVDRDWRRLPYDAHAIDFAPRIVGHRACGVLADD